MIAHCVQGSGFKGVSNYLQTGKNGDDPERVAWAETRNIAARDLNTVAAVMRHTANQSTRCKKPVYHMSISWPETDKVDREVMMQVAERTLADMGLSEHQAMIVAHNDTEHPHLHIVANRVHPETGKAWSASHDRKRAMDSLRAQEKELGLEYVPNKLTDPEVAKDKAPARSRDEAQRQKRLGLKALPQMDAQGLKKTRVDLAPLFGDAENWRDFDEKLAKQGLRLEPKGRGHVITDGKQYAKFSSVGSKEQRDAMAERFGHSRKDFEHNERLRQRDLPFDGRSSAEVDSQKKYYGRRTVGDRIQASDKQVEREADRVRSSKSRENDAAIDLQKIDQQAEQEKAQSRLEKMQARAKARREAEERAKEAEKAKGRDDDRDLSDDEGIEL